jgi:diguanylate cyclase (GGDEF)-like protein/PAS domain S-box-containing protein
VPLWVAEATADHPEAMSPAPLRVTGWLPSRGPARLLVIALALVAVLAAAVVAGDARDRAARHGRAAEALTRLELSAETLKIIGDRYEDGGRLDAGNVRAGSHAWALMEREIASLERRPHPDAPHDGFHAAVDAWRAAGVAIGRTIRERDAATARRVTDRRLMPSLTVLQRRGRELAVTHTAAAADLRLRGTLATLLGAVLAFGAIAARVVAVRRRVEGDAVERRADRRLRAVLDQVGDVVCVLDADGRVIWIASSLQRLLGLGPEAVLGRPLTKLVHAGDRSAAAAIAGWAAVPGGGGTVLLRFDHADGTPRHVEVVGVNHLEDPVLGGLVLSLRDVGERVRLEAAVRHQAFHDPLTGLANRALFEDRLGVALAGRGQGPAVLFLDIDDFKQVNDALGHAMGDALLRAVADRLRSIVREGDTAARVGGDEFAVVLADADQQAAALIGTRLLDALALPVTVEDRWLSVSGSIGVAVADPAGDTVQALLQAADTAMYAAKNGGKRRMEVFSPAMRPEGLGRPELVARLREAIGNGELAMRYGRWSRSTPGGRSRSRRSCAGATRSPGPLAARPAAPGGRGRARRCTLRTGPARGLRRRRVVARHGRALLPVGVRAARRSWPTRRSPTASPARSATPGFLPAG